MNEPTDKHLRRDLRVLRVTHDCGVAHDTPATAARVYSSRVPGASAIRTRRGHRWFAASLLACATLGCHDDGPDGGAGSSDGVAADTSGEARLSYFGDVKPIVDAKCTGCHNGQGVAPLDFTDAAQLHAAREAVRHAITTGTMPPWPPASECSEYLGDRSLSPDQVDTIVEWIDEGAAQGDPIDEAAPLDTGPTYGLTRVDHTLQMAEPFVPGPQPDDYRCFVVDWPAPQRSYLTGLRFNPGESRVVHHGIVFVAAPEHAADVDALDGADAVAGYECFGGPEVPASWLGVWVPGAAGGDFPPDTGIAVDPGSKVILQIHYSANPSGLSDQTTVDVSTEPAVSHEAWIQPWMDPAWFEPPGLLIPADAADTRVSTALDPVLFVGSGESLTIHSVGLHMHLLGSAAALSIERQDGSEDCLLEIPRWDFHWQGAYGLAQPRRMELGDRLRIDCAWDNRRENQPVENGEYQTPVDTVWGEGTRDEMCLGALYVSKN